MLPKFPAQTAGELGSHSPGKEWTGIKAADGICCYFTYLITQDKSAGRNNKQPVVMQGLLC